MDSSPQRSNKKIITIIVVAVAVLVIIIVIAILLLKPKSSNKFETFDYMVQTDFPNEFSMYTAADKGVFLGSMQKKADYERGMNEYLKPSAKTAAILNSYGLVDKYINSKGTLGLVNDAVKFTLFKDNKNPSSPIYYLRDATNGSCMNQTGIFAKCENSPVYHWNILEREPPSSSIPPAINFPQITNNKPRFVKIKLSNSNPAKYLSRTGAMSNADDNTTTFPFMLINSTTTKFHLLDSAGNCLVPGTPTPLVSANCNESNTESYWSLHTNSGSTISGILIHHKIFTYNNSKSETIFALDKEGKYNFWYSAFKPENEFTIVFK